MWLYVYVSELQVRSKALVQTSDQLPSLSPPGTLLDASILWHDVDS